MRISLLIFLLTRTLSAGTPTYELSLTQALIKAKQKSELLKAADSDISSAQEASEGSYTGLLPRLSLDGNIRYVTEVPEVQVIPKGPSLKFGDHTNYSIGPTISYTVWDGGFVKSIHKQQKKNVEVKKEEKRYQIAQLEASVKLSYIKTQFALDQVRLLSDSVKLLEAEHKDILQKKEAGTASPLDELTSKKELLSYKLQFQQKQNELTAALHDLQALVESKPREHLEEPGPKKLSEAKLWILLDEIKDTLTHESLDEPKSFDESSPQLLSQDRMIEALELSAESQEASQYPQIQVSARSSLDYPNGPILKRIHQNTLSLSFSMPLYEFSKTRHLVAEKRMKAEGLKQRRQQMLTDLKRDFMKTKDHIRTLRREKNHALDIVKQADKVAQMTYEAYKIGRSSLVDVQASNFKALQAKVELSFLDVQILNALTFLKLLNAKESSL